MSIPFDSARADRLMGEADIDLLLVTSKHNVQYLLGGYRFIFFVAMDAVGHSRYLPFLIYERGEPQHAGYVGNRMEGAEHAVNPFWTPGVYTAAWGATDAAREILWVVTGAEKVDALAKLRASNPSIPGGRVRQERAIVLADRDAVGGAA